LARASSPAGSAGAAAGWGRPGLAGPACAAGAACRADRVACCDIDGAVHGHDLICNLR
jgi:hypothetical protein